jgi:hypothetical protein
MILYFGLSKYNKIAQKDKSSFLCTVYPYSWGGQNLSFSFLLSQKYNISRSKKLHTEEYNIFLQHGNFLDFFKRFELKFLDLPISGSMELELQMSAQSSSKGISSRPTHLRVRIGPLGRPAHTEITPVRIGRGATQWPDV